jgi:cation:H+ antiporter
MIFLLLAGGLAVLVVGAEVLVRGASKIAIGAGLSPLVVGLTVVAFGTSAPELAVSIGSSLSGQADLALGNVIGSNISNVLLILGASALVVPLVVNRQVVRRDVPIGLLAAILALLLALDGQIGRLDGILLTTGIIGYMAFQVLQTRSAKTGAAKAHTLPETPVEESGTVQDDTKNSSDGWVLNLGLIAGGLALLVLGARWFVDGAVTVAQRLGVSDLVIGLTVVAGGTSLPELATSIMATLRGERDIAVGNVIGSNVFNLLAVLGLSSTVAPAGIAVPSGALCFDFPVLIAVSLACLPVFFTGGKIARWEGGLFLAYYGAYVTYLVLVATEHAALSTFSFAMWAFALPLTAVTLLVLGLRTLRTAVHEE